MTSFPESASNLNDLDAGLTAIQQGNPTEAILLLESFLNTQDPNSTDAIKAQMGLVRAYVQVERQSDAIALCRSLAQSRHEKVRSWAAQKLLELEPASQAGFVPIGEETAKQRGKWSASESPLNSPLVDDLENQERLSDSRLSDLKSPKIENLEDTIRSQRSAEPQESKIDRGRTSDRASVPQKFEWRQAGRSQRWQAFKSINPARLQWAEIGTAIALFGLLYGLCAIVVSIPHLWFRFSIDVLRMSAFMPTASVPVWTLVAILMVLFVGSPWILDGLLKFFYGMRTVNLSEIARSSPETHRLVQRFCQQRKVPIPNFGILPIQAPISFTYGCLPRFARIVVSQGLLDQLEEDEIAAIYASELGHVAHWNFCWMSWVAAALLIPYTLYRQSAIASDWMKHRSRKQNNLIGKLLGIGADVVAILSAVYYGLFWVLRWSGLWLSRQRIMYSDRYANNLTGNPNGLARALLKIAIGTVESVRSQQKTDDILESFELLSPLGYRSALTIGSQIEHLPEVLNWDQNQRDRHWLVLNQSHPLFGERFANLMRDAKQWQLEPEIELESASSSHARSRISQQGAPFFGGAIGLGIASLGWIIAQIAFRFGFDRLNWLASDYRLFFGFALLGFGLGTILRFNRFFPELRKPENLSLTDLLTQPDLIPSDSQPICLDGVLLGRAIAGNSLAQDLTLQTESGFIKLHFLSQFGAVGNLPQSARLTSLVGQSVTITGWFRRGATPWIDVDTIKAPNRPIIRSGHAVWSAIVALTCILISLTFML